MQSLNPLPHSFREAFWQVIIAILLATKLKGLGAFWKRFWSALRSSDKSRAEADEIRTHTVISAAEMIQELSLSNGKQGLLIDTLREKIASKESVNIMLKERNEFLEDRNKYLEAIHSKNAAKEPAAG